MLPIGNVLHTASTGAQQTREVYHDGHLCSDLNGVGSLTVCADVFKIIRTKTNAPEKDSKKKKSKTTKTTTTKNNTRNKNPRKERTNKQCLSTGQEGISYRRHMTVKYPEPNKNCLACQLLQPVLHIPAFAVF